MSKCVVANFEGVCHTSRGKTVSLYLNELLGRFKVGSNVPSLKKSDSVNASNEEIS